MTHTELVEVMARAKNKRTIESLKWAQPYDELPEYCKHELRQDAAAALAAIRAQGVRLMPREITGEMTIAYHAWAEDFRSTRIQEAYDALIAAGEIRPEEGAQ